MVCLPVGSSLRSAAKKGLLNAMLFLAGGRSNELRYFAFLR